jgi:hypothetical protein
VATRLILPEYIVAGFVPPTPCTRCGRAGGDFNLLFPQLNWCGAEIELIYPLRCPCGGSSCVPIRLPTLLFGYILASVALVDAANRRRSKATMTVTPHRSDLLVDIFRKFDGLMKSSTAATLQSPTPSNAERNPLNGRDVQDAERAKFGFDENEWKDFLRRLGLDTPHNPENFGCGDGAV